MNNLELDTSVSSDNNDSIEISQAADMFSRLSPDAQDAIIDLIKSLLSEQ